MATEAAKNGLLPQGMYAVTVNTPLADGSVYHDVKYGQTLWSIAIAYGTTIKKIQELNGLTDTTVRPGEHLLILKNAPQPAAPASLNGTPDSSPSTFPTLTVTRTNFHPLACANTPNRKSETTPWHRRHCHCRSLPRRTLHRNDQTKTDLKTTNKKKKAQLGQTQLRLLITSIFFYFLLLYFLLIYFP
ncbi:MAG: LysM peptidoglycan-binding domain-containing protein [Anaerolineales bacterium]|uniref:LysM peptidoglycan-binding domain-containing protein n=1 Tax=Candidatus Villigracilis proximus TaxID=3140683 RepID=UPI003136FCB6|nr:LysM peptidoglycan-binding domain-containing protein [Anaerolineales bacterium]